MSERFLMLAAFIAAAIAAVVAWAIVRWAPELGLVDVPNERSSHATPVPRGAGAGMALGVLVGASLLYLTKQLGLDQLMIVAVSAAVVGGIGYVDDLRGVSASRRLVVHCVAAASVLFLMGNGWAASVGPVQVLVVGVAGVSLVWGLNLYNFMDGIDGLALQEAIFLALAGAYLLSDTGSTWPLVLLPVAAACAVLLWWNWAPAKAFLGDTGSGFLGFLLTAVAVDSVSSGHVNFAVWPILGAIFLVDATMTLMRRISTRQQWYAAHRSHAYQRLARRLGSHALVSCVAFAINVLWLFPWGYVAAFEILNPLFCFVMAIAPLTAAAYMLGAGLPEEQAGHP